MFFEVSDFEVLIRQSRTNINHFLINANNSTCTNYGLKQYLHIPKVNHLLLIYTVQSKSLGIEFIRFSLI